MYDNTIKKQDAYQSEKIIPNTTMRKDNIKHNDVIKIIPSIRMRQNAVHNNEIRQ